MKSIIVLEDKKDWPLDSGSAEIMLAEEYLTDPAAMQLRAAKIFNLCRSYKYQSLGYYVSLLAAARGHKPLPSVATMVDFKLQPLVRIAGETLSASIQRSFAPLQSDSFTLSIYFGKNTAKRYDALSAELFRFFPAPLLRAIFVKEKDEWRLKSIRPIAMNDVPDDHRSSVLQFAQDFFQKRAVPTGPRTTASRMSLAILHNPAEEEAPSCNKTLQKMERIAEKMGIETEFVTQDDIGRLAEFDALFIRETTNVNHHTFRFSRRAQAEGLVVIDDPDSILRCSNKVYLAELLNRAKIPSPRTVVLSKRNFKEYADKIEYPCILKQPDSAFSRGVKRVDNREEYLALATELLADSDLVIAQQFLPTSFDWRVGILNGEPLYVCRYHMAKNHWQIVKRDKDGKSDWGKAESLPLWQAPPAVIKIALQACNLIGKGLYGVDVKEVNGEAYIIEVNDNPDIHMGTEDQALKDELYQKLFQVFLDRVEEKRSGKASHS